METPPRRRCAGKLLAVLIGILFAAALIEGGLALAAHRGLHLGPPPSYEPDHPFWDSDHTAFGIWHHPNARWEHTVPCFSVTYESNSQGARDVEREIVSDAPRVIVLGDSIAEGWGLPLAERFSGVLERETGVEHLNFAMSHFSPYQQYLVYRDLAKRYSHDATIVTVSSINDFIDLDAALATGRYAYEYSYRPYLVPEGGSFHHVERRESTLRRLLRHYTYTFPAINRVRRTIRDRLDPPPPVPRRFSNFYDFEERAFAILERTLELIAEEMGGKLLFVVLLPFPQDMHRYEADGPDPLSARLAAFAERTGARIVNLLPAMYAKSRSHTGRWNRYVFDCDVHWNALAHATAAYTIRAALEGTVYGMEDERSPGGAAEPSTR